ncbi:MAG TPA: lytic transglycosylase domain-containing protein [Thermoanaerobaculia bacterium]|nr:lytic transglycosylase domain-containing protein [Thermoanaerobaculia bacterium]
MQKRKNVRYSFVSLAAVLFLAVSFHSTPSNPSVPGPQDLRTLPAASPLRTEELTHWLATGDHSTLDSTSRGFHVFRPADLSSSQTGERRLGLFQPGPGDEAGDVEARRRFLYRMPYGSAISIAAERHHADGLLLAAVVSVESDFTPRAVSPQGALGLMQVTPEVGQAYGARDLFDPFVNVDVGCRYLKSLLKGYDGNLERALAAYNAGPGAVERYRGVPPYAETRSFVRDVLDLYAEYSRKAGIRQLG